MGSSSPAFSLPPQKVTFKGLLFDMDGTIIDSTSAVEKHWGSIGAELGVDPKVILQTSHGRRSIDVLKLLSPEKANWEYIKHMEGLIPLRYGDDAVEIPGARVVLDVVTEKKVPWAIVTSGTAPLVTGWLKMLRLPLPENLVVAEDVENGKPDPTCYLMGMGKLGLKAGDDVLVFEDSPAGIKAGRAAGCKILGLVTSHTVEQIIDAGPDWIVQDLRSFKIIGYSDQGVEVEISNALALA
ncbi:glycerol-3-phosphate phosphatase-like protein [Bisporella sp. PMI_857]|nr:glycerol-3-phosphate phosphatase-like protein [Bisporella sp. PMI_857]